MTDNKGEPNTILPSWLIALAMSGFGVVATLMLITLNSEIAEMKTLTLVVFILYFVIWLYFGCRGVVNETPEWSTIAKRAESIGSTLIIAGIIIGTSPLYLFLAIPLILLGTILNIIIILHPSSRIK